MKSHFDVIIAGAGPGGSTLATLLSKHKLNVALIEKESFPTFKIGESLLPYSMDILKESGVFQKIDSGKYIRKYGASFISHLDEDPIYFEFANGLDKDHTFAFEVPRGQFDLDLLDHARSNNVTVLQPEKVQSVDLEKTPVAVKTDKQEMTCDFFVDATGRNAFLGNLFKNRKMNPHFINNIAVYNHFSGVSRKLQKAEGDIIIGVLPENSWSWHIPFKGEVTSVGIVFSNEAFKKIKNEDNKIQKIMSLYPKFQEIMKDSKPLKSERIATNYSYSSQEKVGKNWMMLGDAATFLDPVFSSGVHISLKSAKLASEVILQASNTKKPLNSTNAGSAYEDQLKKGVDRFQSLLLLFYKTSFLKHMSRVIKTEAVYKSFTSAIGGDMWNDQNLLFRMGVLQDGKLPNEDNLI